MKIQFKEIARLVKKYPHIRLVRGAAGEFSAARNEFCVRGLIAFHANGGKYIRGTMYSQELAYKLGVKDDNLERLEEGFESCSPETHPRRSNRYFKIGRKVRETFAK